MIRPLLCVAVLCLSIGITVRYLVHDFYFIRAVWALGANDFPELVRQGEKALQAGVFDHQMLLIYGDGLVETGSLDEAQAVFRRCLDYHPWFPNALVNLGLTFDRQNRPDSALAYYRKALALTPGHYVAQYNMATLFQRTGQIDSAIAYYRAAIRYGHTIPAVNLGGLYLELGEVDSCIAVSKMALADPTPSIEGLVNLGRAYAAQGRLRESIEAYGAFLEKYRGGNGRLIQAAIEEMGEVRRHWKD